MDCRMSLVAAFSLALGAGCVTTQPNSQPQANAPEPPPHVAVQKAPDGPKRPPLPGTVVALAVIRERAADKAGSDKAQQMKLYDEARQLYQEALKIDPKHRDAVQGLARVYIGMGDYSHALEIYQKALDKNPKDHGLWYDMGMCYSRKKELARGLPCFQKALELEPENRQYMKTLGFTYVRLGQTEPGLAVLTRALGTALAHYNLAGMMYHMGDAEKCREHLNLALQINPDLEQAREMLAALAAPRATLQFSVE
jgi:tetratricopeptide (TPR) repeat protein